MWNWQNFILMNINLPLWSFATHLAVPAAFILAEYCREKDSFDYKPPEWDAKKLVKNTIRALALGTLVSTAIAFGTPSFHSTCKFIPSRLREGTVGLLHIFASTIGLLGYQALKTSDSA